MNHEATKPVRVTAFAQARECKSPSAPGEVFVKVLSDRGSTPLISTRINSPPVRWAVCFDRSGELNQRALGDMRNTVDYAGRQGIKSEFAEELFMERKLTEKEKLLLGESFNPEGKELINQRTIAHGLCAEYNAASELDEVRRKDILNCLLGEFGRDAFIQGPIQLDYGFRTFIGDRTYINFNLTILDIRPVHIGNDVLIGPNVSILTANHPMRWQERNANRIGKDTKRSEPVTIEDNCWIAGNVTICAGVTIGMGCVIGAGSVVTRDIPAGHFAAGNPCRVISKIE